MGNPAGGFESPHGGRGRVPRILDDSFLEPMRIECRLTLCRHHEACSVVGSTSGMLPIAKSIFSNFGLDWRLPGHGLAYMNKVKGQNCGDWRARGCLRIDLHVQNELDQNVHGLIAVEFYHRSCGRAECPVCKERWAAMEAAKIENRLKAFWSHGKVLHVAISPTEHDVLTLPFDRLRAKMYSVARSRGIMGGVSIFHPWRENNDGTWRVSPHFHLLCYGWVKNVVEGYDRDGWIVINIQDGKEERSIKRTAMYQLSHCGLSEEYRTVTWFGFCSYSQKAVKVPKLEKEAHICPGCKHEFVELRFMGFDGDIPDQEEGKIFWLSPSDWVEAVQTFKNY